MKLCLFRRWYSSSLLSPLIPPIVFFISSYISCSLPTSFAFFFNSFIFLFSLSVCLCINQYSSFRDPIKAANCLHHTVLAELVSCCVLLELSSLLAAPFGIYQPYSFLLTLRRRKQPGWFGKTFEGHDSTFKLKDPFVNEYIFREYRSSSTADS